MSLVAQYLNPGLWGDTLRANVDNLGHTAFWGAVLQVIFIDMLVSGDNAVIIAMACRKLPPRQRFWGMAIGAGLAVLLLIVFTGIVTQLMQLPYLKLIGGIALFYVAAKLLLPNDSDRDEVEAVSHLWRAVRIVVVADLVMSFDNIIAVAAVAKGSVMLLVIGLAVSIPVIMLGAAILMAPLNRFPIFIWAGAALLGWVAGESIATDPAVSKFLAAAVSEKIGREVALAAAGTGAVFVIAMGGLWRQLRLSRISAAPAGE